MQVSRPLHFGDYGGLPLKIIWALLDLITIIVLVSGIYLWAAKRKSSSARRKPLESHRTATVGPSPHGISRSEPASAPQKRLGCLPLATPCRRCLRRGPWPLRLVGDGVWDWLSWLATVVADRSDYLLLAAVQFTRADSGVRLMADPGPQESDPEIARVLSQLYERPFERVREVVNGINRTFEELVKS